MQSIYNIAHKHVLKSYSLMSIYIPRKYLSVKWMDHKNKWENRKFNETLEEKSNSPEDGNKTKE